MGPEYRAWDEPDEALNGSMWGLRAGEAARRQGSEAMGRYLLLLLKARHEDRKELGDRDVLKELAKEAGLDVQRFEKDLDDRSTLEAIAQSHTKGVEEFGVFGTPTFVFENGASAFLKLIRPKTDDEAVKAFDSLMAVMEGEVFVGELKRPQPPWPKGIFD